jgi:hypothetical protein
MASRQMIRQQQDRLAGRTPSQATTPEVRARSSTEALDDSSLPRPPRSAASSGDETVARQMGALQKQLLSETVIGRQLQESVTELEAATKSLQDEGKNLTRERLLDLVVAAPSDARVRAYVSLARPGMDYGFFQALTEKIESSQGASRGTLELLRSRLLEYVKEVDQQMELRLSKGQELIEAILATDDVERSTRERLKDFSQDAVDIAGQLMRDASDKNDSSG